jgi:hypothetical protein
MPVALRVRRLQAVDKAWVRVVLQEQRKLLRRVTDDVARMTNLCLSHFRVQGHDHAGPGHHNLLQAAAGGSAAGAHHAWRGGEGGAPACSSAWRGGGRGG